MTYRIDYQSDDEVRTRLLAAGEEMRIGTTPEFELQVAARGELHALALLKAEAAGVAITNYVGETLAEENVPAGEKYVLREGRHIIGVIFVRRATSSSPLPAEFVAEESEGEERVGGGEVMTNDVSAAPSKGFGASYRVDLTRVADDLLSVVFGDKALRRLEVDAALWAHLQRAGAIAGEEPTGGDDLEWLIPQEFPRSPPPSSLQDADGELDYDALRGERVSFAAVQGARLVDAVGTGTKVAAEVYRELWTFIRRSGLSR